jgi:hypothetical protein
MARQFAGMTPAHREFIARQRIFFTASATASSRVNVSPRPTDALRVLDERTVAYLDLTGSGSETAAHLRVDGRITLMFCALDEPPSILRLYGRGTSLSRNSNEYAALLAAAFDNQEPRGAGRSSESTSIWCRPPAAMACRCSNTLASGIRCAAGRSRRAMRDWKNIVARKTRAASTACRPVSAKRQTRRPIMR